MALAGLWNRHRLNAVWVGILAWIAGVLLSSAASGALNVYHVRNQDIPLSSLKRDIGGGAHLCAAEFTETEAEAGAIRSHYSIGADPKTPWILFSHTSDKCAATGGPNQTSILAHSAAEGMRVASPAFIKPQLVEIFRGGAAAVIDHPLVLQGSSSLHASLRSGTAGNWLNATFGTKVVGTFGARPGGYWAAKLHCDTVNHVLVYVAKSCDNWTVRRTATVQESVRGSDSSTGAHPYVVRLEYIRPTERKMSTCSGILLTPTTVLTAGHCAFKDQVGCATLGRQECDSYNVEVPTGGASSVSVPVRLGLAAKTAPVNRQEIEYAVLKLFPSPEVPVPIHGPATQGVAVEYVGRPKLASLSGYPNGGEAIRVDSCAIFFERESLAYHTCQNAAGMSGAPIWLTFGTGSFVGQAAGALAQPAITSVVGIHTWPAVEVCNPRDGENLKWYDASAGLDRELARANMGDCRCPGVSVTLSAIFRDYCGWPLSEECRGLSQLLVPKES